MKNKLAKILFSTRLTSILFIVFAVAMAAGTILDRNMDTSPTPYTRNMIYNAWWFEAIMVFFVINFVGNVFRYRLFTKKKWATFILHASFILILLGAFITRYIGYEGMMPIREGATENVFLSQKTYITGFINGDYKINGVAQRRPFAEEVDFSGRMENDFDFDITYDQQSVNMKLERFVVGAEKDIVEDETGENYLKIVEAGNGSPHNHFLKEGEVQSIHNVLIALNKPTKGAINITNSEEGITINSPFEGEYLQMATMSEGKLVKDSIQPLMLRSRYVIGEMQMVFPKPVVKGTFDIVKKSKLLKNDEDGAVLTVTTGNESKQVLLLGGKGTNNGYETVEVGGLSIDLRYGSKVLDLPFSIKLNDFEAAKYPGTEKGYASFSSKVTINDEQEGDFDYKIFMNNVLDHRGYRFFQSGFDPDEKGTILSVNHDFWGTWVTYIGYFLLYIGLMAILFDKNTRFADIKRQLEKVKEQKKALITILFVALSIGMNAQETHSEDDGHNHTSQTKQEVHSENDGHDHNVKPKETRAEPTKAQIDSILVANVVPEKIADNFGRLVIQDVGGRMLPVDTYSSELLRKISKKDTYEGLTANQVFLSIQESPMLWYNVPIILLKKRKGDSIRKIIGVPKDQKYVKLLDFFTEDFRFKLDPYIDDASSAQIKSGIQKEFVETYERVTLLSNAIEGRALKIFPIPNDDNNKWISAFDFRKEGYNKKINDTIYGNYINSSFDYYLYNLNNDKKTKDFTKSNKLLTEFTKLQNKLGEKVMLSEDKINAEIAYNKYDIFKKLFSWYMYAGSLMFVILIFQIFREQNKALKVTVNVFKVIILGLFVLHTLGLIARWYISGHAPWSDAYESMIYVAWATMFFTLTIGVTFVKKALVAKETENATNKITSFFYSRVKTSDLTLAAGTFVTSMILMIAHWNWMDPAIANLQPVLDSYWLMIHVAVIVASYGPFTLAAILGFVCLLLMILTNEKNKKKMLLNIKELTIINEMALTVGLVMLTIGNFLGGQWANESWGRYWGWDPKETWALISIMLYAFVIHMRLVPGLRGRWLFNLMSIITFGSILMTYFGVNFYLSGLHSYASGDQILSFQFIAITLGFVAVLGFFSYLKYKKFYKK